jgi:hypothetical protein
VKHLESRDPKDGEKDEIEMLIEMVLDGHQKPNEVIQAIQKVGFKIYELNLTVNPRGAVEPTDPGSLGKSCGKSKKLNLSLLFP